MSRSATARLEQPADPQGDRTIGSQDAARPLAAVPVLRPSREIVVRSQRDRGRSEGLPRDDSGTMRSAARPDYRARALALWPRLDAEKLRRTRGEAARIARLVERRTALPFEVILGMLTKVD
jgi:hypothetical protein